MPTPRLRGTLQAISNLPSAKHVKTVLHTIETSGPGGAEKMLIGLVDALDRTRFRPLVCLLKNGWLYDQLVARGIEPLVVPLGRSPDFAWIATMRRLLREQRVDVIHAHEFYMNSYATLLSRLTSIPCITTVHGRNFYADRWARRLVYRYVSRHSSMIAVSEGIRHHLREAVGVRDRDLQTIRNGIDTQPFAVAAKDRVRARAELQLDAQAPVIGCLGNLYPVKGHTYLVEAAAAICARHPQAVFLFAGRGQMLESLQAQAAKLGVEPNVRFLGFREDTPRLLAAMDIFVLPSLSEGLPLSLLEAMAARRAVVASAVGGIPEVIEHRRNGMLVPPANAAELAKNILALLDAPELRDSVALQGQHDVEASFNMARMKAAYESLYDGLTGSVLSSRERPPAITVE